MARSANIKSGWKVLFEVLQQAAFDSNHDLVTLTFSLVSSILDTYKHEIVDNSLEECCGCLIAFGRGLHNDSALAALGLLTQALDAMFFYKPNSSSKPQDDQKASSPSSSSSSALAPGLILEVPAEFTFTQLSHLHSGVTEQASLIRVVLVILQGLVKILLDSRAAVRNKALHVLSHILSEYGPCFGNNLWKLVFTGVMFPMFDAFKPVPDESTFDLDALAGPLLYQDSQDY